MTVPADACAVLRKVPLDGAAMLILGEYCEVTSASAQFGRLVALAGMSGAPPLRDIHRALVHAPLPSWLASALWQRLPRIDGQFWTLVDILADEELVRLDARGAGIPSPRGLLRLAPNGFARMLVVCDAICPGCEGKQGAGCTVCNGARIVPLVTRADIDLEQQMTTAAILARIREVEDRQSRAETIEQHVQDEQVLDCLRAKLAEARQRDAEHAG